MAKILFRCDSSRLIGSGHVKRCLALATELRSKGVKVYFAVLEHIGNCTRQIEAENFDILAHSNTEWELYERIKESNLYFNWVIFDHYTIDFHLEGRYRAFAHKIMIIDDLANRKHDCDLLVDTNDHGPNTNPYAGLIPTSARCLVGPNYAILRREFREILRDISPRQMLKKAFVFFGGTDPLEMSSTYSQYIIQNSELTKDFEFHFAISKGIAIQKFEPHAGLHFHIDPAVAQLMSQCDFYIGSGGTITWERMFLGLTGFVIAVAENQIENAKNLDLRNCHYYLGEAHELNPKQVFAIIKEKIKDKQTIEKMRISCSNLVDGKGVEKIVAELC